MYELINQVVSRYYLLWITLRSGKKETKNKIQIQILVNFKSHDVIEVITNNFFPPSIFSRGFYVKINRTRVVLSKIYLLEIRKRENCKQKLTKKVLSVNANTQKQHRKLTKQTSERIMFAYLLRCRIRNSKYWKHNFDRIYSHPNRSLWARNKNSRIAKDSHI